MFLPMNVKEMKQRGWDAPDFIYVSGDSYVDHPSFGAAIITRVLEDCGCRVVFLSQPNWRSDADFTQFGKPRLGFMVSAGNIDSMVAHYTVAKRRRRPRGDGLLQHHPQALPRQPHHYRRAGGVPAPLCTLRLLERQRHAVDPL